MTTTTSTHTAASLAALAPRELDALAHETVMQERTEWRSIFDGDVQPCAIVRLDDAHCAINGVHEYSTSLDAAALLEAELARRGLIERWAMKLLDNSIDTYPVHHPAMHSDYYEIGYDAVARIAMFSPSARTIAAILAVQDSPYLQIVTWDKHPKDAANSQSASDSPGA